MQQRDMRSAGRQIGRVADGDNGELRQTTCRETMQGRRQNRPAQRRNMQENSQLVGWIDSWPSWTSTRHSLRYARLQFQTPQAWRAQPLVSAQRFAGWQRDKCREETRRSRRGDSLLHRGEGLTLAPAANNQQSILTPSFHPSSTQETSILANH